MQTNHPDPIKPKAIGILGGTFDPIHHGHLRMAIALQEQFNLRQVHITPCYQPVHRHPPVATPEQRLAMIKAAITDEPKLIADPREIQRRTPSYTITSLAELRQEQPETPLCLLIGLDAFLGFLSWHRWQDILDYAHLIIAHRPQYQLPLSGALAELIQARLQTDHTYLHEQLAGGIYFHPIPSLEISATDIRKIMVAGKNPRYLLPNTVYDYIKQDSIY